MVKNAKHVETPSQFTDVLRHFVATAHQPFEKDRGVVLLDERRPWSSVCSVGYLCNQTELCVIEVFIELALRRNFLAGACPVMIKGIGGPGAPHHLEFNEDWSNSAAVSKAFALGRTDALLSRTCRATWIPAWSWP